MIIDCIADLHGFYPDLPGGDLLIIAGDLTAFDKCYQYVDFYYWFATWGNYKKVIVIGGNHDTLLQEGLQLKFCEYLCDSGTEFEGLKIWGMPWTTTFKGMNPKCKAFTKDSEEELMEYVEMIPEDTDILITHGPAHNILDKTLDGRNVGHGHLFGYLKYVCRPKLHVFGHIHESYGKMEFFSGWNDTMVKSVNASHVNERYEPVNKPIRVIL